MNRSFWMVVVFAVSSAGCALRPRYADFVSPSTQGPSLTFLLTEKATGRPLADVKVEMSENRQRVTVKTAADGTFSLPVDAKYLTENPVIVVFLPQGVTGYELNIAPPPVPTAPTPAPTEAAPPSNG